MGLLSLAALALPAVHSPVVQGQPAASPDPVAAEFPHQYLAENLPTADLAGFYIEGRERR